MKLHLRRTVYVGVIALLILGWLAGLPILGVRMLREMGYHPSNNAVETLVQLYWVVTFPGIFMAVRLWDRFYFPRVVA